MYLNISNNNTIYFVSNSSTSTVPTSIYTIVASWIAKFYYVMSAYYGPCICFFSLNNLLVLLVMIEGGPNFRKHTSKTARLYYIAFSFADIGCVLSTSLDNFTGQIDLQIYSYSILKF